MTKLIKSSYNKMVFGVCGGLSHSLGLDATVLRIIFVIATIAGVGSPILIYLIMAAIMPTDPYA